MLRHPCAVQVSFLRTLDKGISQFDKFAAEDKASGQITGPHAFMLYDTFGFPLDLTVLMAEEKGLAVDKAGYEACMAEQRARSRGEGKEGDKVIVLEAEQTDRLAKELAVPATEDSARYNWVAKGSGPRLPATVKAIWDGKNFLQEAPEGELVGVVTDVTSFYAESGGQLFDTGKITTADGTVFVVSNVQKFGAYILHIGTLGSGAVRVGGKVDLEVDYERRALCAANHTSTHLLNWALRKVLAGSTIDQRGSIVGPDKLRFDFSYGKPMRTEELAEVQTLVRELIAAGCPVYRKEVALASAKQVGPPPRAPRARCVSLLSCDGRGQATRPRDGRFSASFMLMYFHFNVFYPPGAGEVAARGLWGGVPGPGACGLGGAGAAHDRGAARNAGAGGLDAALGGVLRRHAHGQYGRGRHLHHRERGGHGQGRAPDHGLHTGSGACGARGGCGV